MSDANIDVSDTITQLNNAISLTTAENDKIDENIEIIKQKVERAKAEGKPRVVQRHLERMIKHLESNKRTYKKALRTMNKMVEKLQDDESANVAEIKETFDDIALPGDGNTDFDAEILLELQIKLIDTNIPCVPLLKFFCQKC